MIDAMFQIFWVVVAIFLIGNIAGAIHAVFGAAKAAFCKLEEERNEN